MAINLYTGLMGSGKTYEVVANVIIPALASGRNVASNIHGLNYDKIKEYLINSKKIDPDKIGELKLFEDERLEKPYFFPNDKGDKHSLVKYGDLVVVDEAWRFWRKDKKPTSEHMEFFRMHRHYTDPNTGVACDLAVIIQSPNDLNRYLKDVIEVSFKTVKIKSLGFSKVYKIETYEGTRVTKANRLSVRNNKYNPKIFDLYQSYSGANGTEQSVDDRQNILKSTPFKIGVFLVPFVIIYAVYTLFNFFNPKKYEQNNIQSENRINNTAKPNKQSVKYDNNDFSDFYIIGYIMSNGRKFVILKNNQNFIEFVPSYNFTGNELLIKGTKDYEDVTNHFQKFKIQGISK